MLAQIELAGNRAVAETFSHQGDYLFFAWSQQRVATLVEYAQRRDLRDLIEQVLQLAAAGPDLPFSHGRDASAKKAERRLGEAYQAAHSGTEGAHHQLTTPAFMQQDFSDLRMRQVD